MRFHTALLLVTLLNSSLALENPLWGGSSSTVLTSSGYDSLTGYPGLGGIPGLGGFDPLDPLNPLNGLNGYGRLPGRRGRRGPFGDLYNIGDALKK